LGAGTLGQRELYVRQLGAIRLARVSVIAHGLAACNPNDPNLQPSHTHPCFEWVPSGKRRTSKSTDADGHSGAGISHDWMLLRPGERVAAFVLGMDSE